MKCRGIAQIAGFQGAALKILEDLNDLIAGFEGAALKMFKKLNDLIVGFEGAALCLGVCFWGCPRDNPYKLEFQSQLNTF